MVGPVVALAKALKTSLVARFQRIFFTRSKKAMKDEVEADRERKRKSTFQGDDAEEAEIEREMHEHHPVPGFEENVQIHLGLKLVREHANIRTWPRAHQVATHTHK